MSNFTRMRISVTQLCAVSCSTAKMKWLSVCALLVWSVALPTDGYRPVIIMHGIFSSYRGIGDLVSLIQSAHPGTEVYNVNAYNDADSVVNMWDQVHGVQKIVAPIIANATDGVNLICYSQGGLVCRGLVEAYSDHNVRNFISLSSPQAGQFGDTEYLKYLFPNFTRDNLYLFCYTNVGQDVSLCNYWNDPLPNHHDRYKEYSNFLYPLDSSNSAYSSNFEQLEHLVLIGGPDDGVIMPWQSSHFAFYDENLVVQEYQKQQFYINNNFGLKTLDETGRIHIYEIPGVQHIHWHGSKTVFDCCIEPWLT